MSSASFAEAGSPVKAAPLAHQRLASKPGRFYRCVDLRRFTAHWGWGRRDLIRVDLTLAHKGNAFFDYQFGRADIAKQFRSGFEINFVLGNDVAGDLAANNHG